MQGRPQKSHHRHGILREVLCLGHERGAFALRRRLDRGGDGAHGAQALRELIVKLARQMSPLLLLPVDEPRRQCRSLPGRAVEACRQRVEDLADALKLDKPKARQAARQVTPRQSIESGKNILRGAEGAADRDVEQHANRANHQRGQAEQRRDIPPDRGENGGRLGRDDQRSVGFPVIGDRTQRSRYGRREAICRGRKTRPAARHCPHSSRCKSTARCCPSGLDVLDALTRALDAVGHIIPIRELRRHADRGSMRNSWTCSCLSTMSATFSLACRTSR